MNYDTVTSELPPVPRSARVLLWMGMTGVVAGLVLLFWVEIFYVGFRHFRQQASIEAQQVALRRLEANADANQKSLADLKNQLQEARSEVRRDYDLTKQQEQHAAYAARLVGRELPKKASSQEVLGLQQRLQQLELRAATANQIEKDQEIAVRQLAAKSNQELAQIKGPGRLYKEFEITQLQKPIILCGITLNFEDINPSHTQYSVKLRDDLSDWVEKKNVYLNEPIYWYYTGRRDLAEVLVKQAGADSLRGYLSVPKTLDSDGCR